MKAKYGDSEIEWYEIAGTEDEWESILDEDEKAIEIALLFTPPEHRGKGSATAALDAFIDEHKGQDIYLVCCPKENEMSFSRLVDFYEGQGFSVVDGLGDMPYPVMVRRA